MDKSEIRKSSKKPRKETDYTVKIIGIQFLVCGLFLGLIFTACRLSPDSGASIKAKYNEIMLTDISFSQVIAGVKEVAKYVMKPVDVNDYKEATEQETTQNEFTQVETTKTQPVSQKNTDEEIAAVMSIFSDSESLVAPVHGRITSYFGERTDPISGENDMHNAIDIAVKEGTCVAAANDGIVTETGYDSTKGHYIWLVHKNGTETFYCHNSQILVNEGTVIRAGETIAFSGNTGYSTGPHLHFAIKKDGKFVDPLDYLKTKDGTI